MTNPAGTARVPRGRSGVVTVLAALARSRFRSQAQVNADCGEALGDSVVLVLRYAELPARDRSLVAGWPTRASAGTPRRCFRRVRQQRRPAGPRRAWRCEWRSAASAVAICESADMTASSASSSYWCPLIEGPGHAVGPQLGQLERAEAFRRVERDGARRRIAALARFDHGRLQCAKAGDNSAEDPRKLSGIELLIRSTPVGHDLAFSQVSTAGDENRSVVRCSIR